MATGKAPALEGKREKCCQIKLQKIASSSLCFAAVGFYWVWAGFFSIWEPELKYSQGRLKSNSNLCSSPILFFLIFPLQKNKSTLEPWHFPVPPRSEGQAGTQQQLDSCKPSGGRLLQGKELISSE